MIPAMTTILITGANGGLGQAIASRFLADPVVERVYLGVNRRREAAEALAAAHPGRAVVLPLDVTQSGEWTAAVEKILQDSGRIDVLVNNAGFHRDALLATMDDATWTEVVRANLDSVFLGCRAVLRPMMARRFGRIINIASLSALMAPAGQTNYAAAKAGVVALTRSLAKEAARAGITVNAVLPGYLETEALAALGEEERKILARTIPMRRFGRAEEVAAAVAFLACPEASYVTGSALKIDGGIL